MSAFGGFHGGIIPGICRHHLALSLSDENKAVVNNRAKLFRSGFIRPVADRPGQGDVWSGLAGQVYHKAFNQPDGVENI